VIPSTSLDKTTARQQRYCIGFVTVWGCWVILDLATLDREGFGDIFDVCVVGSGPAGMSLSRRLAAAGVKVAMMEGGGLEFDGRSQELYEGESVGQDYYPLDVCRLRLYGGTSNHWGGMCRTFDAVDFTPLSYHAFSGWPIARSDLDPYRAVVDEMLELPSEEEEPDFELKQAAPRLDQIRFRFSPPVRLGPKYHADIEASDRITLVVNANLVDMRLDDEGKRIEGAVFRSYEPGDPGLTVRARVFALCTGGLENPRLLLNFNSQEPAGIGNRYGMVGRFFNEHPHFSIGRALMRDPVPERLYYAPKPEFMREHGILNFGLRLEPSNRGMPSLTAALVRTAACKRPFLERLYTEMRSRELDCVGPALPEYLGLRGNVRVRVAQEQQLDPASRVMLADTVDMFGLRQARLDWRVNPLDIHTMRTAIITFAEHVAQEDLGRVQIDEWLLAEPARLPLFGQDEVGGPHHMCTTRMAADPRHGVVDGDCRVHGLDNLYVGGSSVFGSGGHANPTYTIIQLALRLGDHIPTRLAA